MAPNNKPDPNPNEAQQPLEADELHTQGNDGEPEIVEVDGEAAGEILASQEPDAEDDSSGTAQLAALKDQLLRLAADFDNFRKRSRREHEEIRQHGNERLLVEMLPVLDNLSRALMHSTDDQSPVLQGVRMVVKQFEDVLGRFGVSPIEAKGKPFSPEHHEALGQAPSTDIAPGVVFEEVQRGYLLNNRLLRPAQVIVATAPVAEPSPQSEPADNSEVEH